MTDAYIAAKPLTVNPLKVSQPMGAALAFMGLASTMPLEHGAQGCTAFSKAFFTRHFREPIALQTTAMDHIVTIIGADQNVVEALCNIADMHAPQIVGLISTGLAEMQGADIARTLKQFRAQHPEHAQMSIVPVAAPDTLGNLESGFAAAVEAIITALVPESASAGRRPRQVNLLASSMLTPGDVETIVEWIEAFGLHAVVLPDLGDSMDGHLDDLGYRATTQGGTTRAQIASMGESIATLVVGASLDAAADVLAARTAVPDFRFAGLMGLAQCDAFCATLAQISQQPVPRRIERQRAQLLDAMVDCLAPLGTARVAVGADPDLLLMQTQFLHGLGATVVSAVASARAPALRASGLDGLAVGDLQDLEFQARERGADLLLSNSHAAEPAARLGLPLLRAGFPLYDQAGAYARAWVGYRGSRQAVFDLANLLAGTRREVAPYRSIYWQNTARAAEQAV